MQVNARACAATASSVFWTWFPTVYQHTHIYIHTCRLHRAREASPHVFDTFGSGCTVNDLLRPPPRLPRSQWNSPDGTKCRTFLSSMFRRSLRGDTLSRGRSTHHQHPHHRDSKRQLLLSSHSHTPACTLRFKKKKKRPPPPAAHGF